MSIHSTRGKKNLRCRTSGVFFLLLLFFSIPHLSYAIPPEDGVTIDHDSVITLQNDLDAIKQKALQSRNDKTLELLSQELQNILTSTDSRLNVVQQKIIPLNTQLNILGPEPTTDAVAETAEVADNRRSLTEQRNSLEKTKQNLMVLQDSIQQLAQQISSIRRDILTNQLTLNNGSVLTVKFWQPVLNPARYDEGRIANFYTIFLNSTKEILQSGYLAGTILLSLLSITLLFLRKKLEVPLTRLVVRFIPEGRMIRSFYALVLIIVNMLVISSSAWLFTWIYLRLPNPSELLATFLHEWFQLCMLIAFFLGIGRALVSKQKPSWRLANIPDHIAEKLNPFPRIIAGIMFIFGTIETISITAGTSVYTSVVSSGMTAISMVICLIAAIFYIKQSKTATDKENIENSAGYRIFYLVSIVLSLAILAALLTGYIGLARYLAYKAVWFFIVISTTFFLFRFWTDACEIFFTPGNRSGNFLQHCLKLEENHLSLLAIIFSAIGKISLIAIMLIALFDGSFGHTTPADLIQRLMQLWTGQVFGELQIVPSNLGAAILTLFIGIYCLRKGRQWLSGKLLPNTHMDKGMQASLSTLFSNVGFVVVIMLTLAGLGVKWSNLAWIVSALSVGIGFGLQEIVKNFISGVILLTERPVRVGDLVSISGIEGDIKKISVRATEIQLPDFSTVIVPNSQFISQNVRNVTMGAPYGVVSIELIYPLNIDPLQIKTLLLEVYQQHNSIVEKPEPSVSCTNISKEGVTMKVMGFVPSARMIVRTRSDLLFAILHQLNSQNIAISVPQSIKLEV